MPRRSRTRLRRSSPRPSANAGPAPIAVRPCMWNASRRAVRPWSSEHGAAPDGYPEVAGRLVPVVSRVILTWMTSPADFESAQTRVKALPKAPNPGELLELYALFKQATQG